MAAAWEQALQEEVGLAELQDAIRRRDAAEVRRLWDDLVPVWDDRTFYDFVATAPSFAALSYRHREVFGQVGFGTGGWDSDFPNSMLEILRVVVCEFESNQHLVVGGAEQVPRRLWTHIPDRMVGWPHGTSLASLHAGATPAGGGRGAPPRPGRAGGDRPQRRGPALSRRVVHHPELAAHHQHRGRGAAVLQPVWMALDRTRYMQSSKTFVMVDRPFWRDVDPVTGRPLMSMTLTDRNTRGTYLFDNGPDQPG